MTENTKTGTKVKKRTGKTRQMPSPAILDPIQYITRDLTDEEKALHQRYDEEFINFILSLIKKNKNFDWKLVVGAYNLAISAHQDIMRRSGDPYFQHLFDVAKILSDLHMDSTTISAGFLHDIIEDTDYTHDDIQKEFQETIADLVDGVTKIGGIHFDNKAVQQAENFRKMLLSMAHDIRVIIIKLADRLNNMRTLEHMPQKKRQMIATETIEVYAPLAHRLGMAKIKIELEDLCLKFLDNKGYMELARLVNRNKKEREKSISQARKPIIQKLKQNNIKASVQGRAKHFYSIHHKMENQKKSFEDIYDLLALRIVVDKKEECYAALGLVHSMYTPLADRFKDYIATPKNNGYQSLHTTVVALDQLVEIQIRTKAMHKEAEEGIAAHWNYKEGSTKEENDQYILWIRKILEQRNEDSSVETFMDDFKADLYQDEVFVYSPKGELFKLPQGSTTLDFAFEIHSNLGIKTIGAKVNGHIVPLKYQINNGEVIEIITTKNPIVNRDWLNIVTTSKARHSIRKQLKEKEFADSAELGKQMLDNAIKKADLKLEKNTLENFAKKQGFQELKGFYAALGHDDLSTKTVINKLNPDLNLAKDFDQSPTLLNKFFSKARKDVNLRIEGIDNMMITFAKCCQPVPGNKIICYVTRGMGVTVHRNDCNNIVHLINSSPKEKIVEASWGFKKASKFPVQLIVSAEDRYHLLQDITNAIAKIKEVGLLMVNMRATDGLVNGNIMVEVNDLDHLNQLLKSIRKVDSIIAVERYDGQEYKI